MTTGKKRIPRGIRNNNPLNIRIGNQWLGERPCPNDPSFEQFVSMECGQPVERRIITKGYEMA